MNFQSVKIFYEDKGVLVVNKPAGLVTHSDGRTGEPTVVDWLLKKYPKIKGVGEFSPLQATRHGLHPDFRSGIVHRLDRETSGALLIAKNQKSFEFLKKQFQSGEVEKIYNAFVYGRPKEDSGVIDRPIARSKKDFRLWSAQRGARGREREAVTEYTVLARITAPAPRGGGSDSFSFLELKPKTGRTHQIRVHLKAINHPVVCDKLYAPKRDCALGFSRLALHALSIAFTSPSGKTLVVQAPYPEDFKRAIGLLKNLSSLNS